MAKKEQKVPSVPAPPEKKRVQQGGYTYKPITSIIVLCECGNKYVSTRVGQTTCVRCIQERQS